MRRSNIRRTTSLKAKTQLKRSSIRARPFTTKEIASINSGGLSAGPRKPLKTSGETKRKKIVRQQKFYGSYAWKKLRKEALQKAGGRCEAVVNANTIPHIDLYTMGYFDSFSAYADTLDGKYEARCPNTEGIHVHHKKGSLRFGGNELPEDLICLCPRHHAETEARDFPHRTHALEGKRIPR